MDATHPEIGLEIAVAFWIKLNQSEVLKLKHFSRIRPKIQDVHEDGGIGHQRQPQGCQFVDSNQTTSVKYSFMEGHA